MSKQFLIAIILILGATSASIILVGPRPKTLSLMEFSYDRINDLKGFTEAPKFALNADSLSARYKEVRIEAKAKANSFIRQRNTLNTFYHILCILIIIISLIVSYLGATSGLLIDPSTAGEKISQLKDENLKFRKAIIFLSVLSVVLTTVSNRLITYYDKSQNKANEVIELIKSSDAQMSSTLSLKEVANTISALELDVEKY